MNTAKTPHRIKCPKCGTRKTWRITIRDRKRCAKCRHTFSPKIGNLRIEKKLLRKILKDFLLELGTNQILEQNPKITKYQLLKIMQTARIQMTADIPYELSGTVEVDETYLGGSWKNKRLSVKKSEPKSQRGRGTTKQAVFGILCRSGKVHAELIDGVKQADLQSIIERKVQKGSTICSDTWTGYTGIAAKGYVHRIVNHGKNEYSDFRGGHINGLEGFWGYLKRNLVSRGGIRKSRLRYFLGEYVWRYNHRKLSITEKTNKLFNLIVNSKSGVQY
jgi:transposase-like protein